MVMWCQAAAWELSTRAKFYYSVCYISDDPTSISVSLEFMPLWIVELTYKLCPSLGLCVCL